MVEMSAASDIHWGLLATCFKLYSRVEVCIIYLNHLHSNTKNASIQRSVMLRVS